MIIFFGVIAVLGVIGFLLVKGRPEKTLRDDAENTADLNDRFSRARYMEKDGN